MLNHTGVINKALRVKETSIALEILCEWIQQSDLDDDASAALINALNTNLSMKPLDGNFEHAFWTVVHMVAREYNQNQKETR